MATKRRERNDFVDDEVQARKKRRMKRSKNVGRSNSRSDRIRARRRRNTTTSSSLASKIQERLDRIESKTRSYWRPGVGNHTIRILPSWAGPDDEFYVEVPTHYSVGPDNKVVVCPRRIEKTCPICDLADKYSRSASHKQQSRADGMYPNTRYMFNVIVRGQEEKGVQIWSASQSLFAELMGFFVDPDYGNFTDPLEGFDIMFRRIGEGKNNTRYKNLRLARSASKVGMKNWRQHLYNLDKKHMPPSSKKVRSILEGTDDDDVY